MRAPSASKVIAAAGYDGSPVFLPGPAGPLTAARAGARSSAMFTDQGGFQVGETTHSQHRAAIPATASLRVDPERIERMWAMRADERIRAAHEGQFTLGEMLRWASRRPSEVELVDGEFWFITAYLADACEGVE